MNPKISDFGMARIFRENETRAKTNRVVGTWQVETVSSQGQIYKHVILV